MHTCPCPQDEYIPWGTLRYLIGEAMYGGRVSDSFDRRILTTYLDEYLGDFLFDTFQPFSFYHHKDTNITIPITGGWLGAGVRCVAWSVWAGVCGLGRVGTCGLGRVGACGAGCVAWGVWAGACGLGRVGRGVWPGACAPRQRRAAATQGQAGVGVGPSRCWCASAAATVVHSHAEPSQFQENGPEDVCLVMHNGLTFDLIMTVSICAASNVYMHVCARVSRRRGPPGAFGRRRVWL